MTNNEMLENCVIYLPEGKKCNAYELYNDYMLLFNILIKIRNYVEENKIKDIKQIIDEFIEKGWYR